MFLKKLGVGLALLLVLSLSFIWLGFADPGTIYYVDGVNGDDSNTGLSWAAAVKSIQKGIDLTSSGDEVWVADATYTGTTNRNLDFGGKNISLLAKDRYGSGDWIIDCEDSGRGFYLHSGETNSAVIDGFTIRNAEINNLDGAGIYCDGASPQIKNCVIESCEAKYGWTNGRGGAICCKSSTAKITNCIMKNNLGEKHGGGIYLDSSNAEIVDCVIDNNTVSIGNGGGIFCGGSTSSSPTIKNCKITNNSTDTYGGGILCGTYTSPAITNCVIADNSAGSGGGGVFCTGDPAIANCTIADNSATTNGGGIRSYYGANPTVKNLIIWGNTANTGSQIDGSVAVTYSDVQGGWTGTGNIDSDPKFVSSAVGDYHIQVDSPCIDAGNNADVPAGVTTDLDGRTRIFDGDGDTTATVDMGPYEVQGLNYILNSVAPTQAHIGKPVSFSMRVKNVDDTAANLSTGSYFTFTDGTYTYTAYLPATATIDSFATEQLVFDSETVNASFTENTYTAEAHLFEGESEETLVIRNLANPQGPGGGERGFGHVHRRCLVRQRDCGGYSYSQGDRGANNPDSNRQDGHQVRRQSGHRGRGGDIRQGVRLRRHDRWRGQGGLGRPESGW
jgi:parallel beta-helix repeat protein